MDHYELSAIEDEAALAELLAKRLAAGEVGILPTDTVHGIMCAFDNGEARSRIYRMKGRDLSKEMQVLIGSGDEMASLGVPYGAAMAALAAQYWPGPLTVVLAANDGREHGIRVPDHAFLRRVLAHGALNATSANRAGGSPTESLAAGFADLAEMPDFVVHGEAGRGLASTVIRLSGWRAECLREEAVPFSEIEALLNEVSDNA